MEFFLEVFKIYCEEKAIQRNDEKNTELLEDERIKGLIAKGAKSVADLYIEYNRPVFTEEVVEQYSGLYKK